MKLKIPSDFIEEKWIKEQALLLSTCHSAKVIFNNEIPMCTKCKQITKIKN